ncbi:hemagglutinin/amebocyte aggregation factor-like [Engraulis encrasicolus]|uniref:hemagglutinin/amebocyte aggregation factor-like n=1 Tax=Engraulis encrasicolus TaxID=184585 RepID=UPI002FD160AC
MKSFIFCFITLVMAMTATTTLAGPLPSSSGQGKMTLDQIIERLKSRTQYEGPLEVPFDVPEEDKDPLQAGVINQDERVKRDDNDFDGYLAVACPWLQSISSVGSYHSNRHEDRRFSISCKPVFGSHPVCHQSNWVNHFDDPFDFTCGNNEVLTGMFSYHSNRHEDRRFKFQCCSANLMLHGCHWTPYLNDFDQSFNYHVPNHMVIAGVSSYHHNYYEDRRFKFYVCSDSQSQQ